MFSLQQVEKKLKETLLPHELEEAIELIQEIRKLKKEKNAVLLSHNYMTPDIYYGVSDFVGDSLGLAISVLSTTADVIVFNGVHFMAETANLLNPEKLVLIANLEAGCSLAEGITREDVLGLKASNVGVPVVSYINCSAEVKSVSDICCTSANALEIIESFKEDKIIFIPDDYLAMNVQACTKKKIISWRKGRCMVHELYTASDIEATKKQFPDTVAIAHPECSPEVVESSDFSGSTSKMSTFIRQSSEKNVMLITECSMSDNLRSEFPEKNFLSTCHTCPHMKKISLQGIKASLEEEKFAVLVPDEIRERARLPIDRMLNLSR